MPRSLRDFIQESRRGGRNGGDCRFIIVVLYRIARAGPVVAVPRRTARAGPVVAIPYYTAGAELAVAIPRHIAGKAASAVLKAVKGKAKEEEDIRAYVKDSIYYRRTILSRVLDGRTDRT